MYRSPFKGKCHMTTAFMKKGNWKAGYHTGEDWVGDDSRNLYSPTDGTVSYVSSTGSYGNHIIIHTDDGNSILMAHMARVDVRTGQRVSQGQQIGVEGSTGNSTGVHLHIEVERGRDWNYNKNLLKPSDYIDFNDFGKSAKEKMFMAKAYKNGSTAEKVYMTTADCKASKNSIGSLDKGETCECVGIYDGCYAVVYDSPSGKKVGFVKYSGGVKQ